MVRRRRTTVLVAALVLLALGGGYVWQQTWFGGTTESVAGTPYTLRVQGGVPASDVDLVRRALADADAHAADVLGRGIEEPVEVRLATRTPCVPFTPFDPQPTAVAQLGSLCVDTDGPGWVEAREDGAVAGSVVAHERYHAQQAELGCLPGPDEHTHAWLVEGAATWVGWQSEVAAGRVSEAGAVAVMREWGGWDPGLPALADLEGSIGGDAAYALAYRAVDDLVARAGPASLVSFCESVAAGAAWRTAFAEAFGREVDAFYRDFEARRRS